MGCASSSQPQCAAAEPIKATPLPSSTAPPPAPKGKGKGKGKRKGRGGASKFQIELEQKWQDYGAEEDAILKRAYLIGHPNAKYHLRGHDYKYNFKTMMQRNLGTGKIRSIRPPYGMRPPREPLLPPGAMVIICVPEGAAGKTITVKDPNNPGHEIEVAVPAGAKASSKMAVPVPQKGESVDDMKKRQAGFSTGAKVAMGAAALGAGIVGGVVLGDHLTGGAVTEAIGDSAAGEWAAGAAEDAAAWVEGAAEDVGDWAGDAGEWITGAAEDAGEWAEGATEDAGEWIAGATEDIGDWLGDAADDTGDFVMSLF